VCGGVGVFVDDSRLSVDGTVTAEGFGLIAP
jgi:hypothetical protein